MKFNICIFIFLMLCFGKTIDAQQPVFLNKDEMSRSKSINSSSKSVYLEGLQSKDDGGQGYFVLEDKGNEIVDNGIIFASDRKDKIWKRKIENNRIDLNWYGVKGDGVTNDFLAIQNALNYAYKSRLPVQFPQNKSIDYNKSYKLWLPKQFFIGNNTLELKYGTQLLGAGPTATIIRYTGNKAAITVGKPMNDHQLEYGMVIRDLKIELVNEQATGIKIVGGCGVICENINIEGFSSSPARKTIGVHIDGGNASSFFNNFNTVICNHIQTGFKLSGVPPFNTTNSIFINCSSLGDGLKNSIGFEFDNYCGNGTNIYGGNIEVCDIGIKIPDEGNSISVFGLRFEGNKTDIQFGLYSRGSTFVGCMGINKIDNKTGVGYGYNNFIGCMTEQGVALDNVFSQTTIIAKNPKITPLTVMGDVVQKAPVIETKDYLSKTMFQVDPNGAISSLGSLPVLITAGIGSPEGRYKAIPGSLYLQTDGGPGRTLWIKESGNSNTGWKPK